MEEMEKLFAFPSSEYRGKPFWSWNGKLEKEELLRQIEVFHEMGMGGYFVIPESAWKQNILVKNGLT